jgi:hypothetical protein
MTASGPVAGHGKKALVKNFTDAANDALNEENL